MGSGRGSTNVSFAEGAGSLVRARDLSPEASQRSNLVSRRGRLRALGLAALVFGAGIALTIVGFLVLSHQDGIAARARFDTRAADATASLLSHFLVPLEVALSTPAFLSVVPEATAEEFQAFAGPALDRHPSLTAVEWAPRVPLAELAHYESHAQKVWQPGSGGERGTLGTRPDYYPLSYMVPEQVGIVGLDVAFDAGRRLMVDLAIRSGRAVCSPRFQLVEDPPGVYSVAIYAPVFAGTPLTSAERAEKVRGLAIALFRLQPVVDAALLHNPLTDLTYALYDETESIPGELLATNAKANLGHSDLHWTRHTEFSSRKWRIDWTGDARLLGTSPLAYGVLSVGILLSFVFGLITFGFSAFRQVEEQMAKALKLGSYTLLKRLGQGGMGTVYEARHAFLRRRTALKLIRPDVATASNLQRFEREVQATSQLTHPNTIQIFDYGSTPDGIFFYAMEFLDGVHLGYLVRETGPLSIEHAVSLLIQVTGSIAEAHQMGMIHRDIKPDNIMVCQRGGLADFVKVLDFGLVKSPEAEGESSLTQDNSIVGTPDYMAPEVLEDARSVTPLADIYGLGCVFYFMLTGSPPHSGPNLMALIARAITQDPAPLDRARGTPVPVAVTDLVAACLARRPEQRPQSADALLIRLNELALTLPPWGQSEARAFWAVNGPKLSRPEPTPADGFQHGLPRGPQKAVS
jgi:CHASE1-domain containing sensor protein/tRNA A-37 threonylcarbamoyl transferase component Bud32